jgi:16S rRNA (guanine527-N7)-methyltransferase
MKGPDPSEEIAAAKTALKELGGKIEEIRTVPLSGNISHTLILVKKISQTSTKYPRTSLKISKSPL